jgi:hypothetical protein
MKWSSKIGVGIVVFLFAIQLVQCERLNPPVTGDIAAPTEVDAVLRRACYDCHSNQTAWPWYSRVAPVSWLVHRDVFDGRRHLNFSEWDKVSPDKRARRLKGVGREIEHGDMPLWFYLPMHPTARLSDGDKQILKSWYAASAAASNPSGG